MTSISRRVALISTSIAPRPDPRFLAYARALVAWESGTPDEDASRRVGLMPIPRHCATFRPDPTCYSPAPEHTTDRDSGFH